MTESTQNTAINGYFQQRIFNDIIKKANESKTKAKFKSYHARLLERKLDDGWNRMRGKMKKLVDYDAPNSDDSSSDEGNYESSYSYKFLFESASILNVGKKRNSSFNNETNENNMSSHEQK